MTEVERQLEAAGYLGMLLSHSVSQDGGNLMGLAPVGLVETLKHDARFANGVFYQLHRKDFTKDAELTEFRSYRGTLGKGSLQIVLDCKTGAMYADVDKFSPYEDVVSIVGHVFGEMVPNWFRKRKQRRT